jgi:tRNA nucleotidyltransferase (CCA-adding enzyme)
MPLNHKNEICSENVMMIQCPIVLSQEKTVTDSAVRRLVFDAGEDVENLMTLCEADITLRTRINSKTTNFEIVRKKIVEVEERDHVNFQPPITRRRNWKFSI